MNAVVVKRPRFVMGPAHLLLRQPRSCQKCDSSVLDNCQQSRVSIDLRVSQAVAIGYKTDRRSRDAKTCLQWGVLLLNPIGV